MNIIELEKQILKAQTPEEIDAITDGLDQKTLRDIIKLLIDKLTPMNVKMNRIFAKQDEKQD